MGEVIVFCLVFLSQVLLISWVYPRRILSRARYVLEHFPPSTHPKMYTHTPEAFERWLRHVGRLNAAVVVAGMLIIAALLIGTLRGRWDGRIITPWSSSGEWDAAIVAPFFLVQIMASVAWVSFSSRKFFKALAKAPPPRIRTTELRRRRLLDFVSPAVLGAVALTNIAFIGFILHAHQHLGLAGYKAAGNIATIVLMLVVFSVSIGVVLHAPRQDPYQADADRRRTTGLIVRQGVGICLAMPVLLAMIITAKLQALDALEPVITSLFCQGVAVAVLWPMYSFRVEAIDFDVYRRDAGEPDSGA